MTDPTDPRPAEPERSADASPTEAGASANGVEDPSAAADAPGGGVPPEPTVEGETELPSPAEAEAPARAGGVGELESFADGEVESFADGEDAVESFAEPSPIPPAEADAAGYIADDTVAELEAGTGELEWQPVYAGDQISWQPVVASDTDESWPTADELATQWEEQPAADYEAAAGADWGLPEPDDEAALAPAARTRPARTRTGSRPRRGTGAGRARPPDPQTKNRRMVVLLSVLTGVVILVAVLGYVLSTGITSQVSGGPEPTTSPTTSGAAPTLPDSEFVTYRDDVTGLSVKYPRTWQRLGTPVSDVRLQLDGGGNEGMRIRVLPIETPATVDNIENYKAVTDGIAFSDPNNKLVKSQLIQLNGRLAYYYLYTYQDGPTGEQGVHAHYFVFEGRRMFTIVLQAVPADDFRRLAGVFDQIAESFTVPEERTLSTTTTPATTTPASSTSVP